MGNQYIYSLGRVKELEKGLFAPGNIDRLLESDDVYAVLRSLGFFKAADEHEDDTAIAEIFRRERAHNRALLHGLITASPLEDVFLLPYDIHNLKLLLKGKITGNSAGRDWPLEPGKYPPQVLVDFVYNGVAADLPGVVVDDIRSLTESVSNPHELAQIDDCLDQRLRAWQFEIARSAKNTFVVAYLQRLTDVQNLSAIIRRKTHERERDGLAETLIAGGTIDLALLERLYDAGWESMLTALKPTDHGHWVTEALDQLERPNFLAIVDTCGARFLIEFLHTAQRHTFGIEQILAFYLARDLELKVVRTLWMGKIFGCEPDKLRLRNRLK